MTQKLFTHHARHGRVRLFLASEIRDLPMLRERLRQPLLGLWTWLRQDGSGKSQHDILNWICLRSREEVAGKRRGRGFRMLLFFWPALKTFLTEKGRGWIVHQERINNVLHELLAVDYGAAASSIREAVTGKLEALDPRTAGHVIKWAELGKEAAKIRATAQAAGEQKTRGRPRSQVGQEVEGTIPRFRELYVALTLLPRRIRRNANLSKQQPSMAGFSLEEITAAIDSRTAQSAARLFVSIKRGKTLEAVTRQHQQFRRSPLPNHPLKSIS